MFAVLLYHGIDSGERWERPMDDIDREYVLTRSRFEEHVEYLASRRVLALSAAMAPSTPTNSEMPVVISFDDGDVSGYTTAAPILERHGFRGDFFVVSTWIGRPGFMNAEQLRELARRGHGIHSHSRTHSRLSTLTPAEIEDELRGSKADLEEILKAPVEHFSIPGGAYDERVVDVARRAGYTAVLNSVEGYNDERDAPFLLQRFTPRAYTGAPALVEICERPAYVTTKLALKRAALTAARGLMGQTGYERLREKVVSRVSARR